MTYDTTEAKRLADAADRALEGVTEGPWVMGRRDGAEHGDGYNLGWDWVGDHYPPEPHRGVFSKESDARFVAYTRSGVPGLAASLRDAVEEIERLREFVRRVESLSNDGFLARDARALLGDDNG